MFMRSSTINMKKLLGGAACCALAAAFFILLGLLLPNNHDSVNFALQSTADTSQEYVDVTDVNEAVPVNSGRFQLNRILQQFQLRSGNIFRTFTIRELFKTILLWHCLLLAGLYCSSYSVRGVTRAKLLFHLYLNSITPCRAGPYCALI